MVLLFFSLHINGCCCYFNGFSISMFVVVISLEIYKSDELQYDEDQDNL